MFKHKNALISIAVALMLAACGGSDENDTPNPDNGNGTPTQPGNGTPGNGTPGNGTPGNGTPGNGTPGNGTPGNGTPGTDVAPKTDANLDGVATLQNILFVGQNIPLGIEAVTSMTPRTDEGDENLGGYGAYGLDNTRGTYAPLKAIDYRLNFKPTADATELAPVEGRLAFELRDQAAEGKTPEVLQIEIDKILVGYAGGKLTVQVAPDAKMYVYAADASGNKTDKAVVVNTVPAGIITAMNVADSDAIDLRLDIDAAVGAAIAAAASTQAATALASVKNFAGGVGILTPMEFALVLSNLEVNSEIGAVESTISVQESGIPGVIGGGIRGYAQIEPINLG